MRKVRIILLLFVLLSCPLMAMESFAQPGMMWKGSGGWGDLPPVIVPGAELNFLVVRVPQKLIQSKMENSGSKLLPESDVLQIHWVSDY